jgi:hypothetical protein
VVSTKNGTVSSKKLGRGDEVGVEHREELALGDGQRVVDVARLRATAPAGLTGNEQRRTVRPGCSNWDDRHERR